MYVKGVTNLFVVLIGESLVYDAAVACEQSRDAAIARIDEGWGGDNGEIGGVYRLNSKTIRYRGRVTHGALRSGKSRIAGNGPVVLELREEAQVSGRERPGIRRDGHIPTIGIAHIAGECVIDHQPH